MFPLIGFGSISGRPEDKFKDQLSKELAHWSIDVIKGSARGVKHTALTAGSFVTAKVLKSDESNRYIFDKRFSSQVISNGWSYISSKGANNPLYKITKVVIPDAKKNRPKSYNEILTQIAKMAFSNRLKAVSINIIISEISSQLIDVTVARYISSQTVKGFVKGSVSFGAGFVISLADVAEQAYQADLRLKRRNPKLYYELYRMNIECFWWLAEDKLKGFAY
ncbi:hypothetical protein [Francisella philomiragia]|uniref:hypothetical protein n=1 Tax=Francisella philomiragia TaxID=28110 RepID=UPI0019052DA3|nr:hypothetical protein [Francisella philomiragia]MBK2266961.1 hypothetical protein [Francisella philomiragia]MBK2278541.1 hypothetical protein [Francisella philomiragia]MBK2286270.1 hypothetical protein [Francisella philomiragia]MBK2288371.1 hypothetical protein [Francisella philomiragia]MBK2291082.1 hypothetical protein [Francisella philomiragia]